MNPYLKTRQQPAAPAAMSRIDLLLALYDGALERLQMARASLRKGDTNAAYPIISRVQLIVSEMASGVRLDLDEEMGTNYLRLYEFVVDRLARPVDSNLGDAIKILTNLRQGFAAIRDEAVLMERRGEFVASDRLMALCETA